MKFAKRCASFASFFVKPIKIFNWMGILVYRTISYKKFSPMLFFPDAQAPLDDQIPQSIRGSQIWTITPPSDLVMSHVLEIKDGIADTLGNVFDPLSGKLILGATHKYRYKIKRAHISRPLQTSSRMEKIPGELAVCTASNQHIYWHWIFDVLPRLMMLEELEKTPQKIYLQSRLSFQRETLALMGVFQRNIVINCDQIPMVSAATLLVPCHQIMEGRKFPKWVCQSLRKTFLDKAIRHNGATASRIYISRAAANQRRVLNEEEIIPVLQKYGFQVVKLEDLSFREQMGLFRDAEVVLAANGSGLANLVFCSDGARVIELFPCSDQALTSTDYNFNFDYNYKLSRERNLNYYYLSASKSERMCAKSSWNLKRLPSLC